MMFSILIGAYVKSERALALIPLLVGIKKKKYYDYPQIELVHI